MDHQRESVSYVDSAILEPIAEQQDDEVTTSPASSMNASFLDEERRAQEETQIFEEFERKFDSNQRKPRVKFSYSFDDDHENQFRPVTYTTRVKTEPCFRLTTTEDPLATYFYTNDVSSRTSTVTENDDTEQNNQLIQQSSLGTPSEPDSLEEYTVTFTQNAVQPSKMRKVLQDINIEAKDNKQVVGAPSPSRPVGKSILKKGRKQEETTKKITQSSPPALSKKQSPSSLLDSNQVTNLAESSAKQNSSPSDVHPRSLFDKTINIFETVSSSPISSTRRRPSRLRYYIKPYRGEANAPPDLNKHRSRSLSEKRIEEQTVPTRWYTFSNQYTRPSGKQHHVSWSPVREYIHQGREKTSTTPNKRSTTKRKETSFGRNPSSMAERARLSSSNPCLSAYQSMIPVSVRYRPSGFSQAPQHFRQSLPPSLANSLDSPSMSERLLTPTILMSHYNEQYENAVGEEEKFVFVSPLPDVVHEHQKEHGQTMKRYEQLLEKMRATDEQLQSLSRSWMAGAQKPPVKLGRISTMSLTSTASHSGHFFSPLVLQMCLLVLVIFNLLVVYFFNEINIWWNSFVVPAVMIEQHDGETSDY